MRIRPVLWVAVVIVAALAAWTGWRTLSGGEPRPGAGQTAADLRGWLVDPVIEAPDFTLVDQHGREFRLSDQEGKAVVLFFGYTMCPDVCPTTLAQYRDVKRELGEAADGVTFVFVTVDPERDTQERLARYVSNFDPAFVGLRGDREAMAKVWNDYGILVERVYNPENPERYSVNHTSLSYVVDKQGRLRLVHPFGFPLEDVVHDLRTLIEERA